VRTFKNRRLNDRAWLVVEYSTKTTATVAAELGVSRDTVCSALRAHNIPARSRSDQRRPTRPVGLYDPDWLRERYQSATGEAIADELGVSKASIYKALARYNIPRRTKFRRRPESPLQLDDAGWLRQRYRQVSGPALAEELGVTGRTLYLALEKHGIEVDQSPWIHHGPARLTPPPATALVQAWEADGTLKGLARRFGVSFNTVAVWLADVGIFIKEVPAISKRDLQAAIAKKWSIDRIMQEHHVTGRTVSVELRRFGLKEAHVARHLRGE